jgi:hypothetical protein
VVTEPSGLSPAIEPMLLAEAHVVVAAHEMAAAEDPG